ncbi:MULTISPECIES: twin-arginine translocation signal domain-containing protein [Streptomyces violaceoruber group]|nr:twin-arginine translocation signal domain-containing protein [Streptomyces violaceoruber]
MFRDRFQGRAVNRRTFMVSAAATAGTAGALPVMSGQAHADTRGLPSLWDVDRSVVNPENAYTVAVDQVRAEVAQLMGATEEEFTRPRSAGRLRARPAPRRACRGW